MQPFVPGIPEMNLQSVATRGDPGPVRAPGHGSSFLRIRAVSRPLSGSQMRRMPFSPTLASRRPSGLQLSPPRCLNPDVQLDGPELLPATDVPEPDRPLVPEGRHAPAVRPEGDGLDDPPVTGAARAGPGRQAG